MDVKARAARSHFGVALLAAAALSYAPRAHAGDKATAESLFQAGKDLMAQKKYDEACPKFADSEKEDPSPGTLLNLARCHEEAGKTASAWAEYKEVIVMARAAGQSDREQAGRDFAAKLEPTISKLQIDAPTNIPGLEVRRDADVVSSGAFGIAIAIDPGEHTIEASAPGYAPWSTKITIGKEKDMQKVSVPALAKAAATAPTAVPGTPNTTPGTPPTQPPPASSGSLRTVGFVLGGVGVVGLGVGAITGILASSKVSNAKSDVTLCPDQKCTPAGRDAINSASTMATVSTVGLIGGGVLLAGGVILVLTQGSKKKESAMTYVLPEAGPQGGGLTFVGKF